MSSNYTDSELEVKDSLDRLFWIEIAKRREQMEKSSSYPTLHNLRLEMEAIFQARCPELAPDCVRGADHVFNLVQFGQGDLNQLDSEEEAETLNLLATQFEGRVWDVVNRLRFCDALGPDSAHNFMNPTIKGILGSHKERILIAPSPIPPESVAYHFNGEWVQQAALEAPYIDNREVIMGGHEIFWFGSLRRIYESMTTGVELPDTPLEYPLTADLKGIRALLNQLPYHADVFLSRTVIPGRLSTFLQGWEPLPTLVVQAFERQVNELDVVLFPRSVCELGEAFAYLTRKGVRCTFELSGGPSQNSLYRLFACDALVQGLFVVAILRGSVVDTPRVENALGVLDGRLEVGPACFAGVDYLIENLVRGQPPPYSQMVMHILRAMLAAMDAWNHGGLDYRTRH